MHSSLAKTYSDFANDRQLEVLKAVDREGTNAKAAKSLGLSVRTIQEHIKNVKDKAALGGFDPDVGLDNRCPSGFDVTSVRVDANGNYKAAFAKPKKQEVEEGFDALVEAFNAKIKPVKAIKTPKKVDNKLLNLYTLSDLHLGCYAERVENAQSDYTLDIAVDLVKKAFADMIDRSPKSEKCFINLLGDTLHIDSFMPVTPASGHVLDASCRYPTLLNASIELIKWLVETALKNHKQVTLLSAMGNHDPSTAMAFTVFLKHMYEKESRVEVIDSARPYYSYNFGKNMLCFHHGHKRHKVQDLAVVFSSDNEFRKSWGDASFVYGHSGHFHNLQVSEGYGIIWTQHPCLPSKDAYSSAGGYQSNRACVGVTYHEDYGEYSSIFVRPEMFEQE